MTPDQQRIAAQASASAITRLWDSLVPLKSVNRFLQTGAHPDDETTRLLARLAKADGVRLGFACGVRGEGGQNDIGTESRAVLGVLRTREMERAAETLDMELFWLNEELEGPIFDFGLSKTAEETFGYWGRERTVERLVRTIRAFRPDVVAPTFLDVPGQHGHHRAITQATEEAFHLAGDADAFPEHGRDGLAPWQAAKLYLPAWSGAGGAYDDTEPPPNATITVPVGGFDPVHGATYAQIAQWSRAFHRTQGMGHWVDEGPDAVPLHRLDCAIEAPEDEASLFDGLPTTLGELADRMDDAGVAEAMRAAHGDIDWALDAFPDNASVLAAVHSALGAVRRAVQGLATAGDDDRERAAHRLALKERQLCHASRCAALLTARMGCDRPVVAAGDAVDVTLSAYLGGPVPLDEVSLSIATPRGWRVEQAGDGLGRLETGERATTAIRLSVPEDAAEFDPYQFRTLPHGGNDRVHGLVRYAVDGVSVETVVQPDEPLAVLPPVATSAQPTAVAYNLNRAWPITVSVTARRNGLADGSDAALALSPPPGWQVSPDAVPLALGDAGDTGAARFTIAPPEDLAPGRYALPVTVDGLPSRAARTIRHPHIRATHVVTPAEVTVQAMSVALPERLRIGYVDGGSDRVHGWLAQLGCDVTLLDADVLSGGDLCQFDTIVIGIFAYKARPDLLAANARLKDWVAAGGNLVTQYHRPWDNWDPETVPPHFLKIGQPSLRWRVTDQNAAVTHLAPDHPLLTHPNTITAEDWQGWVKERGLYFAADWAPDYTPILSMADPGEAPLTGSLLSAPVGGGRHTHTSLILYYQMDFLVPGAFRLMANLVTPP